MFLYSESHREKRRVIKNSKEILHRLSVDIGERTLKKYDNLERTRKFITEYFSRYAAVPREETYKANKRNVSNIIVELPGTVYPKSIILVGAHYDTIEETPGADDNASGIAALLEIYRIVSQRRYKRTVRFVAFTLEEPPFFSTELMGSMVNAKNCCRRKEKIDLMVCLEMLGYGFRGAHQDYPLKHVSGDAPKHGDYVSVISLPSNSEPVFLWKKTYNSLARRKIHEYIAPASIPGMDLSDHMSFIRSGYPAIMLSDTGFYRNKNYHTPDDSYDTINFKFLAETIYNSSLTLGELLNRDTLSGAL